MVRCFCPDKICLEIWTCGHANAERALYHCSTQSDSHLWGNSITTRRIPREQTRTTSYEDCSVHTLISPLEPPISALTRRLADWWASEVSFSLSAFRQTDTRAIASTTQPPCCCYYSNLRHTVRYVATFRHTPVRRLQVPRKFLHEIRYFETMKSRSVSIRLVSWQTTSFTLITETDRSRKSLVVNFRSNRINFYCKIAVKRGMPVRWSWDCVDCSLFHFNSTTTSFARFRTTRKTQPPPSRLFAKIDGSWPLMFLQIVRRSLATVIETTPH